jgi:hypothetical protein
MAKCEVCHNRSVSGLGWDRAQPFPWAADVFPDAVQPITCAQRVKTHHRGGDTPAGNRFPMQSALGRGGSVAGPVRFGEPGYRRGPRRTGCRRGPAHRTARSTADGSSRHRLDGSSRSVRRGTGRSPPSCPVDPSAPGVAAGTGGQARSPQPGDVASRPSASVVLLGVSRAPRRQSCSSASADGRILRRSGFPSSALGEDVYIRPVLRCGAVRRGYVGCREGRAEPSDGRRAAFPWPVRVVWAGGRRDHGGFARDLPLP